MSKVLSAYYAELLHFLLFDAVRVCHCLPIIFLIFHVSLTFEMTNFSFNFKICDE